jgi:hypothetical protein
MNDSLMVESLQRGTIWPIIFVFIIIVMIGGLFVYHVILYPNGKNKIAGAKTNINKKVNGKQKQN